MWREQLPQVWQTAEQDPAVRVIIFTAAGDRAFCSGADVQALSALAQSDQQGAARDQVLLISARHNKVTKPVITAVNGMCAGGGLMFVADSDIAIAAEHATFFNPGVSIGQLAFVAPTTWTRWVPFPALMRMTLMGSKERLDAQRALELGIVTEVVAAASLACARAGNRRPDRFQFSRRGQDQQADPVGRPGAQPERRACSCRTKSAPSIAAIPTASKVPRRSSEKRPPSGKTSRRLNRVFSEPCIGSRWPFQGRGRGLGL